MNNKLSVDINATRNNDSSFNNKINDAINRKQDTPQTPFQLKIAQVVNADPQTKFVELNIITDKVEKVVVDYPGFMCNPVDGTGIWYGLGKGDIVQCLLDNDNRYKIINKVSNYNTPQQNGRLLDKSSNKFLFSSSNANKQNQDKDLTKDTFLIKGVNCKVKLSKDEGVVAGNLGAMNFGENKWLIQPVYEFIDYFQNEGVFMCIDETGVSFFNNNGEKLNEYSYDVAYGFMFGVCAVEKDGMLNVINKYGKPLLDEWCASVSYPIIEEIDGHTHYVLSISYDVSDGEYSKFIRYIVENDMLVEII